ncbi:MAG: lysylphosphatidylglycerol synthase transmembrane domain-containing protein [Candidatus Kryptoniota bacterium]
MLDQLKTKLFISVAVALAIGLIFSVWASFDHIKEAIERFSYELLPAILMLSLLNYSLRFARWQIYLHALDIKIPTGESLGIFISGLAMAVTPGKMGEVLKSYFLKTLNGTSISKSAPIIVAERLTDLLALTTIAIVGAYVIGYAKDLVLIFALIFVAGTVLISIRPASLFIIKLFDKISIVSKWTKNIETAYESSYTVLTGSTLFFSLLISIAAWFSESLGFYFVLQGLNIHLRILSASFIYSFSTIIGAISFLPGGLAATETSLTGLLVLAKIPKGISVAATLIVRSATLWFAVIIGTFVLSYMQKRYAGKLKDRLAVEQQNSNL